MQQQQQKQIEQLKIQQQKIDELREELHLERKAGVVKHLLQELTHRQKAMGGMGGGDSASGAPGGDDVPNTFSKFWVQQFEGVLCPPAHAVERP